MQQRLNSRICQMLFRTDHVSDLHLRIVNDCRKVVEERAVAAHDDRVRHQCAIPFHVPSHCIVNRDFLISRNQESHDMRLPFGIQPRAVGIGQVQRPADIQERLLRGFGSSSVGLHQLRRVVVAKGFSFCEQSINRSLVKVFSLRLIIGTKRPTDLRAFIPGQAQPAERTENRSQCRFDIALLIRIVNPQNERAVVVASPQPDEECRPHSTNMHIPRRTRSKSRSNLHSHHPPQEIVRNEAG